MTDSNTMTVTSLPFTFVDVFTERPFKGNPLAIVTIPVGVTLTQSQKQAIAREFNLSETAFVHDENPGLSTERHFDIFTPLTELPFAGHPTIGTAIFLYPQGVRTLHAKAGPIDIQSGANGALRAAIPQNVRLHQRRLPGLEQPTMLSRSQLEIAVAEAERGAPLFSIVKGMTFALIELPSLELLGAVRVGSLPDLPADLLDDAWREGWATRRYYFVRLGNERIGERSVHKIRTRMVNQRVEDPATGSAACALSGYLSLHALEETATTFDITQGVEMSRDSNIIIDVEVGQKDDGERRLESLHLGGKAVRVMSGCITSLP